MANFTIFRKTREEINSLPIVDGQFLIETDKGDNNKIYIDNGSTRIPIGGGAGTENPIFTGNLSLNRKNGTTKGQYSTAEGLNCESTNIASHAEGFETSAKGMNSHTEGVKTIANYSTQHAQGYYNDNKSDSLFEIGNGSESNRSNAFRVTESGKVEAQGDFVAYAGTSNETILPKAKYIEKEITFTDKQTSYEIFDATSYIPKDKKCLAIMTKVITVSYGSMTGKIEYINNIINNDDKVVMYVSTGLSGLKYKFGFTILYI